MRMVILLPLIPLMGIGYAIASVGKTQPVAMPDPPGTFTVSVPCYPVDQVERNLKSMGLIPLFKGQAKAGNEYQVWAEFDDWVLVIKEGELLCYMASGKSYTLDREPE